MSKNTGCEAPNYLNPDEPKYRYYEYLGCSCKRKHLLQVLHHEMLLDGETLEYLCSEKWIPIKINSSSFGENALIEPEKEFITLTRKIIKG